MQKERTKVFFPGLNGLRFFAASAVIVTHVELLKQQVGLPGLWDEKKHPFFFQLGGLGVYFFFVLSGFLITYLLLKEKEKTGRIAVRDFYIRRIFRIWPLYYLLVLLAFFVFPHIHLLELSFFQKFFYDHFWFKLFLFLFILPNVALGFFHSIPHAGHAWSIGVEEQFYLIWPWIVRKSRNLFRSILLFGIIVVAIKICILVISGAMPGNRIVQGLKEVLAMLKMECMAIGGLGACVVFEKKQKVLDFIFHPLIQLFSIGMVPLLIFAMPEIIQNTEHILYSILFLVIILNVALNPSSILKLRGRFFDFLGNISYGMYMYHMFIIVIVLRSSARFGFLNSTVKLNTYYYTAAFAMTILVSSVSYFLYERPFIRMKSRFSEIASGTEAFKEKR
jgi:peptidoglycan/LPS O-acetylase OafA/YrhL